MLERFTVVALPYSCAPDEPFQVSLFVSPDIEADHPDAVLAECKLFVDWPKTLAGARFVLEDQFGEIECTPLLAAIEDGLWPEVFVPETPVTSYAPPDWNDRPWRTFSPGRTVALAKFLQLAGTLSSGIEPPTHQGFPVWGPELERALEGEGRQRINPLDLVGRLESQLTETLDRNIGEGIPLREFGPRRYFADRPLPDDLGNQTALFGAMRDLHRARRFYEHPEEQGEYQGRPDADNPGPPGPDKQLPDFADRVSLVNDHGPLQRKLGLVVDLRADPDRLAESEWLCGRIVLDDQPEALRVTRVACRRVGRALTTVAADDDGQWVNGRLRVGNGDLFDVLDVDPDGSALKAERYLASFPRGLAAALQGAPENAAPPALRGGGFTLARRSNAATTAVAMDDQRGLLDSVRTQPPGLPASDSPLLHTEDVMQGVRVDVHDGTTRRWRSLHEVNVTAEVVGGRTLTFEDVAFLEESAPTHAGKDTSPIQVHEALFGWDGWSLSAPRPALPVVNENGVETVITDPQPPADPSTPLLISRRARTGSLPRLRFGRRYAFRVWGVDLAGNSRPHAAAPQDLPDLDAPDAPAPVREPGGLRAFRVEAVGHVRDAVRSAAVRPAAVDVAERGAGLLIADALPQILGRLQLARGEGVAAMSRREQVSSVLQGQLAQDVQLPVAGPIDREVLASGLAVEARELDREQLDRERLVVTPPAPHVRWHPVPPPALVPRRAFSEGESNQVLVIRSWVTQDPATLAVTVQDADAYAAGRPGRFATCERHLVPPKTSQLDAEVHGAFDAAIASADADVRNLWLHAAIRESGTLFDLDVPRLDDPGVREPQDGIELVSGPGAPPAELKTLPLPAGEAPGTGQYVVHDTGLLHTPYLPDVLARGLGFVFPDAVKDRWILPPFGVEGFTTENIGTWPQIDGYRLVLADTTQLHAAVEPHLVRIGVPAGTRLRTRVSSTLLPDDLAVLGPWGLLPEAIRTAAGVVDAATNGWLWVLTPAEALTLVHAVPRPIAAPEPIQLQVFRFADRTDAMIVGGVDLHGPSTDLLVVEARWDDPVDDLSQPRWQLLKDQRSVACTTQVEPWEDIAMLIGGHTEQTFNDVDYGPVRVHRAVHQVGDTRHRLINYRLRATTRFREYFAPDELAPAPAPADPALPIDDGRSTVSAEVPIHVLNTGLPAAPLVHSVLPLFRWEETAEPEQPMARRRIRRGGVRVYLERPWFTTGADELLGVVLAIGERPATTAVSQWGADPFWFGSHVDDREKLQLTHLLAAAGIAGFDAVAGPAAAPVVLPSAEDGGVKVTVVPYRPQYNETRGLWYVDIGFPARFWPFVQLALVRYQPYSVPGRHLSKPTVCDFVQVPPERTASLSRTSEEQVRIVLSGPVGTHDANPGRALDPATVGAAVAANRVIRVKLQQRPPGATSDLAWETREQGELTARGFVAGGLAWTGELPVPRGLPFVRPTTPGTWRVRIEEWETLVGDPEDLGDPHSPLTRENRLIYADEFELGEEAGV